MERAVANGYTNQKSHVELWNLYDSNRADKACRKLSNMGSRMNKERADADYYNAAARIPDRMAIQLNRANDFLRRLAALPPGLPVP
jgi:hypothetical protein